MRQLHQILAHLDRRRIEIGLLSYFRKGAAALLFSIPDLYCRLNIPVARRPLPDVMKRFGRLQVPTPFAAQYLTVAAAALWRYRPDIVYLNNPPEAHLPMIWAARVMGIPLICHLRGVRPLTAPDRIGIPHIRKFVALSRQASEYYAALGLQRNRLCVVYDAIPLREFDRLGEGASDAPLPPGAVYAVQVGLLNDNKRPMLAIKGFELARRRCPLLRLVLIGDGPDLPHLTNYVDANGLRDEVFILGPRKNVPDLLRQCHIGMLLSRHEGMPNSVMEYMAARLPVIVTPLVGIDELVRPCVSGIVLDADTPEIVADALTGLYHDPDRCARLGHEGRRIIEQPPFVQQDIMNTLGDLIVQEAQA